MAKPLWFLEENPRNKRWFLNIPAGLTESEFPDVQAIRNEAASKGINPYAIMSDQQLERSIQKAKAAGGEEFSFPVVIEPTFDVRLIIPADKIQATLYIRKGPDGKVDYKLISSVLNNSLIKGLESEKIRKGISSFVQSPSMELTDYILAVGTPPGRGKDRELIPAVAFLEKDVAKELCERLSKHPDSKGHQDSDKNMPVCDATSIAYVTAGQILYTLSPAEPGTPGVDIFHKTIPGLPGNDPLFQIIENATFSSAGIKADKKGILLSNETEGKLRIRVLPFSDAVVTPIVSTDNMSVSIILEKEEGSGCKLSLELVEKTLESANIHGNYNKQAIQNAINDVVAGAGNREIHILNGQKPVRPGESLITWHVHLSPEASTASITAGDTILSVKKIPNGTDGLDVYGKILKASDFPVEHAPEHDASIIAEKPEDGDEDLCYTAAISGDLIFSDGRLTISNTKTINSEVNDSTGDIAFSGNLILNGNIKTGRAVKAGGSLTVTGDAEASLVSAEESVMMNGGIRGAARGTVWAKQGIRITFAENARLLASNDITVENYCFQCLVKTNSMLLMRGNPGILLGGNIRASSGLEVFELGSEKTIRTSISFGQNYLVSDQIEVCEKEVEKIKIQVQKIDAEMQRTSSTDPRIHELRRLKLDLLKRNDKLTVRIFTLKEQFETHVVSHIRVENNVYPGVILESHGRYFEVREIRNHVLFIFDQTIGQITCNPINDKE